jgi:TIGR00299 family protein
MRILLLDPFRGAAGDMIIGSLIHLGASRELVMAAMASVVHEPEFSEVDRAGIRACRVRTHAPVVHRTLDEVLEKVMQADAPEPAIRMAGKVFHRIERAERQIHGDMPHFHEVGADDAIADVIGACTALHSLSVDAVTVLPVSLGGGTISGSHGTYPVPAPATVVICSESSLQIRTGTAEDGELCTPTGAALLAEFQTVPLLDPGIAGVIAVGYGAGSRNPPGIPNVLRAMLLETRDPAGGQVDILETNVDDVPGEILASVVQRLMETGARDVCVFPCTMKKGRPGYLIRVICTPAQSAVLSGMLAKETGSLGVRCIPAVHRFIAERNAFSVTINIAGKEEEVRVKCGIMAGKPYTLKAEYDDVDNLARTYGIPARDISRAAEEKAWKQIQKIKTDT